MIKQTEEHISLVKEERAEYRKIPKECSDNLHKLFTCGGFLQVPPPYSRIPAMTNRTTIDYSFDMAQQVMFYKNKEMCYSQ